MVHVIWAIYFCKYVQSTKCTYCQPGPSGRGLKLHSWQGTTDLKGVSNVAKLQERVMNSPCLMISICWPVDSWNSTSSRWMKAPGPKRAVWKCSAYVKSKLQLKSFTCCLLSSASSLMLPFDLGYTKLSVSSLHGSTAGSWHLLQVQLTES